MRAAQQRVVLAVLLAEAGRAVSVHRLITEIWGEQPPRTAVRTLQGYVFRLRRMLGAANGSLATRDGGYELVADDGDIDVVVFERLVAMAKRQLAVGDAENAALRLSEALELWRGPAFADVTHGPFVSMHAAELEQSRLDAAEARLDAWQRLGRDTEVVAGARRLVSAHPLRERLYEQMMLGLYRCGRRAEALDCYQQARQTLVTVLGVEPGPQLRRLHRAVLSGDPQLAHPHVDHETPPQRHETRTPAQLPADVAGFAGRDSYLRRLDGLVPHNPATPTVVTLAGPPGVGKTALAVHWGYRVRHKYPDGQLHTNLRGYAAGPPVRPIDALAGFLVALGVPADEVPAERDNAAALYRSLLADKRVLLLLDNARDPDQVRPLLPGGSGCLVVVTSRDHLGGLIARDGAVRLTLEPLAPAGSRTLLAGVLGAGRVAAEPDAVADVGRLCGHLPLALRVAAANIASHPRSTIAAYAERLARSDRLAALEVAGDHEAGVLAAFDASYAALPVAARRIFRLLGVPPGPQTTALATAALADVAHEEATLGLSQLCAAHLVIETTPGRYAMHDLLRSYAARQAGIEETAPAREAALERWHGFYLSRVTAAAQRLYPHILRLPAPGLVPSQEFFADGVAASAWMEAERENLTVAVIHAALQGPRQAAWRLADGLRGYLFLTVSTVDWEAIAGAALAAAVADDDPLGQAAAHLSLAMLSHFRERREQAIDHYAQALAFTRRGHWAAGESAALGNLGNLHWKEGRLDLASDLYTQALAIDEEAGWPAGQAVKLLNIGQVHGVRGRLDQAQDHHTRALQLFRQLGSQSGEARALVRLGETYHALGRLDQALDLLTDALAMHREVADRGMEANTLRLLALVHRDAGRHAQAHELSAAALALARDNDLAHPEADALIAQASTHDRTGEHRRAVSVYEQALSLARKISDRFTEVSASIGLATALHSSGEPGPAISHALEAMAITREHGYRLLESDALAALAVIDPDFEQARQYAKQAKAIRAETGYRPSTEPTLSRLPT